MITSLHRLLKLSSGHPIGKFRGIVINWLFSSGMGYLVALRLLPNYRGSRAGIVGASYLAKLAFDSKN